MPVIDAIGSRFELFLLILARLTAVLFTAPLFGGTFVPAQVKAALSVILALVLLPLLAAGGAQVPEAPGLVILAVLKEVAVGLAIGWVASLVFAAVRLAGQLVDLQMGFGVAGAIDPTFEQQSPLAQNLYYLTALLVFLGTNGHHVLLAALVGSFRAVPVGVAQMGGSLAGSLTAMTAEIFAIALQIAAPVLAALFLTTLAFGILSRTMPQMNVFIVGMPVQIGVGIFVMAAGFPLYVAVLQSLFDRMAAHVGTLLRGLGG